MHKFIVSITKEDFTLIEDDNLECYLIDSEQEEISTLIEKIKQKDKIALIYGESACDVCKKYDADGVLIDLSKSEHCAKDVNFARKQVGDKVLGVISRNRRHESMLISECEPDFVVFKAWEQGVEQAKDLVSWYNEMFLIQSAVMLQEPIKDISDFDCDIIIGNREDYKNFSK
jgi:hypothetical protein